MTGSIYKTSPYKTALEKVYRRIAAAAQTCGRNSAQIDLLAVSKLQSADAMRVLANLGQTQFGESYLQEALLKQAQLKDLSLTWHYIGQLQSNKTRAIATSFDWVHTIDRVKIAERLNEQRPSELPPLNVCLQIKLADESGKGGMSVTEAPQLAAEISRLPRLRLRGLMCIPPLAEQYAQQLQYFEQMHRLFGELQAAGVALDTLSMGMSADLEAAIAAGTTLVRIGTALFGERGSNDT